MTKAILGDHLEGAWDTQAEYTEKAYTEKADTHHNNEQTKNDGLNTHRYKGNQRGVETER